MNLFPPSTIPLVLQSSIVRDSLLVEHNLHKGGAIFRSTSLCSRGHVVALESAPSRLCCFNCRKPLGQIAYCCYTCSNSWYCDDCVIRRLHPVDRARSEKGNPVECSDGKLRFVRDSIEERRAMFRRDVEIARAKIDTIVPINSNHSSEQTRFRSHVRPRLYLSTAPKSFVRSDDPAIKNLLRF
jgi:hypothetical protein